MRKKLGELEMLRKGEPLALWQASILIHLCRRARDNPEVLRMQHSTEVPAAEAILRNAYPT